MNIHFKNKELKKQLDNNTIYTEEVGANYYNLKNKDSDEDYLKIYLDKKRSFNYLHHQFQYKENKTDYNYTTLESFFRNLFTGDSTLNFELIFQDNFLKKIESRTGIILRKEDFISYNVLKSYLGFVKRDLKMFIKEKTISSRNKKLAHAFRGLFTFKNLLFNEDFLLSIDEIEFLKRVKNSKVRLNLTFGCGFSDIILEFLSIFGVNSNLDNIIKSSREMLNTALEKKLINRMASKETLNKVDDVIKCYYNDYSEHIVDIDSSDLIYQVLEDGDVKYTKV